MKDHVKLHCGQIRLRSNLQTELGRRRNDLERPSSQTPPKNDPNRSELTYGVATGSSVWTRHVTSEKKSSRPQRICCCRTNFSREKGRSRGGNSSRQRKHNTIERIKNDISRRRGKPQLPEETLCSLPPNAARKNVASGKHHSGPLPHQAHGHGKAGSGVDEPTVVCFFPPDGCHKHFLHSHFQILRTCFTHSPSSRSTRCQEVCDIFRSFAGRNVWLKETLS